MDARLRDLFPISQIGTWALLGQEANGHCPLGGREEAATASEVAAPRDFYGALGGDGWLDGGCTALVSNLVCLFYRVCRASSVLGPFHNKEE